MVPLKEKSIKVWYSKAQYKTSLQAGHCRLWALSRMSRQQQKQDQQSISYYKHTENTENKIK